MEEGWIPVAYYEDPALAQRHVDLLRKQGIRCMLNLPDLMLTYWTPKSGEEEVTLLADPEDVEKAHQLLDEMEELAEGKAAGSGDQSMLAGGVASMVGVLSAMGSYGDDTGLVLTIAYGLAFVGGSVFLRGLIKNRAEENQQS
jgi:hypothetical protein